MNRQKVKGTRIENHEIDSNFCICTHTHIVYTQSIYVSPYISTFIYVLCF